MDRLHWFFLVWCGSDAAKSLSKLGTCAFLDRIAFATIRWNALMHAKKKQLQNSHSVDSDSPVKLCEVIEGVDQFSFNSEVTTTKALGKGTRHYKLAYFQRMSWHISAGASRARLYAHRPRAGYMFCYCSPHESSINSLSRKHTGTWLTKSGAVFLT